MSLYEILLTVALGIALGVIAFLLIMHERGLNFIADSINDIYNLIDELAFANARAFNQTDDNFFTVWARFRHNTPDAHYVETIPSVFDHLNDEPRNKPVTVTDTPDEFAVFDTPFEEAYGDINNLRSSRNNSRNNPVQ